MCRQIEAVNNGLANVRVRMTGDGAKPGINGIDCFPNGYIAAPIYNTLDLTDHIVDGG